MNTNRTGEPTPSEVSAPFTGAVEHREADVVLHAEQLLVSRKLFATERVRFTKQIVTTTRTVEVPVRTEQLVISHEPFPTDTEVDASPGSLRADSGEGRGRGVVIVLHEEVPEFTLRVVPVEQVTIAVRTVAGEQTVTAELGAETVSVQQQAAVPAPE